MPELVASEVGHDAVFHAGDLVGGRFRIEHLLGSGGMGEVYSVVDETDGARFALKTLHTPGSSRSALEQRFAREAELLCSLRHPAVARLHHSGVDDGRPYFTMTLLHGETLAQRLARGPMTEAEVRPLVATLCDALDFIHARGVIHRDLKPSNVFLTPDGAVLTDFGLARPIDISHSSLSESSQVLGTLSYAAPEQLLGTEVTPRTDVYALAVVAFEALTGRLPFDGESPLAQGVARLSQDPLRITEVATDLPPALERLLVASLSRKPQGRPASAGAFGRAFEDAFGRARRRRLGGSLLAAAVALALVGAFAALTAERSPRAVPRVGPAPATLALPPMASPRDGHTATMLPDGRVLVAGGTDGAETLGTTEIFDPATRRFRPGPRLREPRRAHTATLLPGGVLLLVGGAGRHDVPLRTAELLDPRTGAFESVRAMEENRIGHAAVLLRDGRVLVVGGGTTASMPTETTELFDPRTREFEPGPSMAERRFAPIAAALRDGRVLVGAGYGVGRTGKLGIRRTTELLDAGLSGFRRGPDMNEDRFEAEATPLADGRLLVTGGYALGNRVVPSAELFDPAKGLFLPLPAMSRGRAYHAPVLLPDGRVAIGGGSDPRETEVELFDPRALAFTTSGALREQRIGGQAVVLSAHEVLFLGGTGQRGISATAELLLLR